MLHSLQIQPSITTFTIVKQIVPQFKSLDRSFRCDILYVTPLIPAKLSYMRLDGPDDKDLLAIFSVSHSSNTKVKTSSMAYFTAKRQQICIVGKLPATCRGLQPKFGSRNEDHY